MVSSRNVGFWHEADIAAVLNHAALGGKSDIAQNSKNVRY
jgi:hypothetical protein